MIFTRCFCRLTSVVARSSAGLEVVSEPLTTTDTAPMSLVRTAPGSSIRIAQTSVQASPEALVLVLRSRSGSSR